MAKRRPEDPPKGAPAWQSTFSDLMNLLLCFFVLLFSMSTVDAEKFQLVIASLTSSVSVLPGGSSSIGDGRFVANSKSTTESTTEGDDKNAKEQYEQMELSESEKMSEQIEKQLENTSLQDAVEVDFNAQYVQLSLNGALLFESGKSDVMEEAYPVVNKISSILAAYQDNLIEIEGHTDNVPVSSRSKYESNDVLSMYRALSVANYIRDNTSLNPAHIKSSGRGDYDPVADNSTPDGRARNRRVEIKVYNSYNSEFNTN